MENDITKNLMFWKMNKSFENYNHKGLFKARTVLVSALYLCYILEIKEIELYGVSLDNGAYFYNNSYSLGRKTLDTLSQEEINKKYYGYTMQKIVQEVLEYLVSKGFIISYGGESNFLKSIDGVKQV